MKNSLTLIKKNSIEIGIITFSLIFSSYLMFSTFSYQNGSMMIATKAWSDFATHIPLIRSFSYGVNFPPEYPLFPGEPIRYHFLFYFLVGMFEKLGLRIDLALNILSSLSFAALLIMIYLLAKRFFLNKTVGILSVIFFLFNGTLSFLEFFKTHPLSINTINDILSNKTFPSFGPYDGKIVSAFWNLNIYTNQRHLALSFAITLFLIYLVFPKPLFKNNFLSTILLLILTAFLFFLNQAVFLIAILWIIWILILNFKRNLYNLALIFLEVIFLILFSNSLNSTGFISIRFGFLSSHPFEIFSFVNYWIANLGLYIIFIPLSFFFLSKRLKLLIIPLIVLFIVPNIFQLSPDIINNHKFFNFLLLMGGIFAANFFVKVWNKKPKIIYLNYVKKFICIIFVFFLTLSGIIDFMPIKNDSLINIDDIPKNADASFIKETISPHSIILNSTSLYHPASIAGRSIFFGYSYFAWSYGYDNRKRENIYLSIYRSQTKEEACRLLKENNISYVELSPNPEKHINPNWDLWKNNFKKIYENKLTGFTLYDAHSSCLLFFIK